MATREHVEGVVHKAIDEILPGVEIDGRAHLKDLGADSVDRVEIILAVLDRLGVSEPLSSFGGVPSIDALVDYLWERLR